MLNITRDTYLKACNYNTTWFSCKASIPGILGDRISGFIVLAHLWSSGPKIISLGVIPPPPRLLISAEILQPSDPASWFSWTSCGGSELLGKIQEMEMLRPKRAKIISPSVHSEPVILSTLTSPCPPLHFLLLLI